MADRFCEECGSSLRLYHSQARTCSARCRKRLSRRHALPDALTSRPRWVRRTAAKRPVTAAGKPASVTDPATWASFTEVRASSAGVGLGFVLNGDGVAVIDLDDCIADGRIADWAAVIVEANAGTFMETSQSGRGMHIWGLMPSAPGRRIRDGRKIEIYSTGRYMAMGTSIPGTGKDLLPLKI